MRQKGTGNIWKKTVDFISDKKIAEVMLWMLVLSLVPILYLAGYARPSGDDYGYSVFTHAAWWIPILWWKCLRRRSIR